MSREVRCKLCKDKPRKLFELIEGDDWTLETKCGKCGGVATYSSKDARINVSKGSERNVITIDTNTVLK